MAVFICTFIFKIGRMPTYRLCVYIYVCGRGEGVGQVGQGVMWVCKRE